MFRSPRPLADPKHGAIQTVQSLINLIQLGMNVRLETIELSYTDGSAFCIFVFAHLMDHLLPLLHGARLLQQMASSRDAGQRDGPKAQSL